MASIVVVIRTVSFILTAVVIAEVILSYFLSYDHPIRRTLDMIVEPMLGPIRRFMPALGGLDFSPMVLLILIQLIEQVLIQLLFSFS